MKSSDNFSQSVTGKETNGLRDPFEPGAAAINF
jgi:hypothetical protein